MSSRTLFVWVCWLHSNKMTEGIPVMKGSGSFQVRRCWTTWADERTGFGLYKGFGLRVSCLGEICLGWGRFCAYDVYMYVYI